MSNCPLRYQISNWRQLTKCLSNNSNQLHIRVTEFIQDSRLSGLRIQVEHEVFGVLFACVVDAAGSLISPATSGGVIEFTPSQILAALEKYGFIVKYSPVQALSGNQIQFLMTLKDLHYDKLRILEVWETKLDQVVSSTYVVAFNIDKNPEWLNNAYSPPLSEYQAALQNGSAINVGAISSKENYSWSWLHGFVANIDDVLADIATAQEVKR